MRSESEKLRRRSGTSGEKLNMKAKACIPLVFFLTFVFDCRQKEREQLEALRKHHSEEIDHHKKEIERLQKEIDRHKGKIRKLSHDD